MRKSILGMVVAGLLFAPQVWALTAAGTVISNQASVVYTVNSELQPAVDSNFDTNGDGVQDVVGATTFQVDRKIDLTVARQGAAAVPGTNGATVNVPFMVKNDSNEALRFTLSAADTNGDSDPFGGAVPDTLTAQSFTYEYEDAEGSGTYVSGSAIPSIPAGEYRMVNVKTVLPATAANGAVGVIVLTATATETGGAAITDTGTNSYNAKDTIRADSAGYTDAANAADHSDASAFTISSAALTVNKSSSVYDDFIAGSPNYAIPGAVVQYSINISNTGTETATAVTLIDQIPNNTELNTDNAPTGGTPDYSNDYAGDPNTATWGVPASVSAKAIKITTADIPAGNSVTVTFFVTIK